jgi:hypothetical protein
MDDIEKPSMITLVKAPPFSLFDIALAAAERYHDIACQHHRAADDVGYLEQKFGDKPWRAQDHKTFAIRMDEKAALTQAWARDVATVEDIGSP